MHFLQVRHCLSYPHDLIDLALSHRLITVTTRYPPSANRAMRTNTATMLGPQAPPPLVTDSDEAVPGCSVLELDNGKTGGSSSFTSPV